MNAAATALVTAMAIRLVGNNEWALLAATGVITFLILVFSEITPKVIGATFPERIALPLSYPLSGFLRLLQPVVWFVNLFVKAMLWAMRIPSAPSGESTRLTSEELRTLVLEGGNFIPGKHRSILLNLFDLEALSVDDVMMPRARIESLDIEQPADAVLEQLRTCYHNKIPVHEGDINRTVGVLHVRKLMHLLAGEDFTIDSVRGALVPTYFIPSGTPLFQQLQHFQDNKQRLGLVVDEYGEVQGLVTLEDIIEEIVGEFATNAPGTGIAPAALDRRRTGAGGRDCDAAGPEPPPRARASAGRPEDAQRAAGGEPSGDPRRSVLRPLSRRRHRGRPGRRAGDPERPAGPSTPLRRPGERSRARARGTSLDQLAFNAVVKVYKSGGYLHYLSPSLGWADRYNLAVRQTDRHPEESSDIRCLPSFKGLPLQER